MAENDYIGDIQNQRLNQQWSNSMAWQTPSWMRGGFKKGPTVQSRSQARSYKSQLLNWDKGDGIMTSGFNDGNKVAWSKRTAGLTMPTSPTTSGPLPAPTGSPSPAPTGSPSPAPTAGTPPTSPTPTMTASTRPRPRSPWGTPSGTTI
jgi:hypothetical protein